MKYNQHEHIPIKHHFRQRDNYLQVCLSTQHGLIREPSLFSNTATTFMDIRSFFSPPGAAKKNIKISKEDSKVKEEVPKKDETMIRKPVSDSSAVKKTNGANQKIPNAETNKVVEVHTSNLKQKETPSTKDVKKRKIHIEESEDENYENMELDERFDPKEMTASDNDKDMSHETPKKKLPKRKSEPSSSSAKKTRKSPMKKAKEAILRPTEPIEFYSSENATPGILDGLTFVFTGNMENFSREDATDYLKCLGGRVTSAVSGKTDYLVTGSILEDGRAIEEGSKYKKAIELGAEKIAILKGPGELYALVKMLNERARKNSDTAATTNPELTNSNSEGATEVVTTPTLSNPYVNPYHATSSASVKDAKATTILNPYAKVATAVASNPYINKSTVSNPYASKVSTSSTSVNPYAIKSSGTATNNAISGGGRADITDPNALWADKYAPNNSHMVLGNKDCVTKLKDWLQVWERTFNTAKKVNFNPKFGPFRAALISGPPGIGKTTSAVLVAEEAGRHILELNASDARSKTLLESSLMDVTGCQVLNFGKSNKDSSKRCIIMDEVDGMGAGDRGGIAELIKLIKTSKVPIICICNDRQSQKVKSLANHCLDLRFKRPVKSVIARRAMEVGKAEGMDIEFNAAEAIVESCGNDIRQVLNCLQMWGNKKINGERVPLSYRDYKDRDSLVNKDEILRISLFDAAKIIIEGRRGLTDASEKAQVDNFFARTDAFFSDYAMIGLLVHQNYLKCATVPFQKSRSVNDSQAELDVITRMQQATDAMSDFSVVENEIRSGDMNWALLPLCSVLAVKTGYHIGGEGGSFLGGFPEFTTYLGRNSTKGKRFRLLQEFAHHMNYRISADNTELRMGYIPALRGKFEQLLFQGNDGPDITEAIDLMDAYGLDRDDLMENLDEFSLNTNTRKFSDLDSKAKAAFTREYNKGVHKSQALVDEQGVVTRKRKKISEDEFDQDDTLGSEVEEEETEDNEEDEEAIKKLFQKSKTTKSKDTKSSSKKK